MEKRPVVERLYFCFSAKEVNDLFEEEGINTYPERIKLLKECTKLETVHELPKGPIDPKDDYEWELLVFVDGTWRLL